MKRIIVVLAILASFLIAALLLLFSSNNKSFAVSGCCKVRDTYREKWRLNGMDFRGCEKLNQKRDRDNVFDKEGLVWWDTRCQ